VAHRAGKVSLNPDRKNSSDILLSPKLESYSSSLCRVGHRACSSVKADIHSLQGKTNSKCGRFEALTSLLSTNVAWSCDRTSSNVFGRYFSTHGWLRAATTGSGFDFDELAAAAARAEFEKKLAIMKYKIGAAEVL
jgi:hypothetical protein